MPLNNGKLPAVSPHTAPSGASRPLTMMFCL